MSINRGTAKNLTQKPRNCDALSWSPDGKLLAFAAGDFSDQKLYTIDAENSKLTQLAPRLEVSGVDRLAWSSDSQQIAFAFNEIKGEKSHLYAIGRGGTGLTKLSDDQDLNASTPVWQPQ